MNTVRALRSLIVTTASLLALGACGPFAVIGSGHRISETREVAPFTKIDISDGVKATVSVGAPAPLVITGDDNVLELFTIEVRNGTLVIEVEGLQGFSTQQPIEVTVGAETLTAVGASGASTLFADKATGDSVSVSASGASNVVIAEVDARTWLVLDASGASILSLTGTAPSLEIDASGASRIDPGLSVVNAKVSLSGASTAAIELSGSVSGSLSGASTLYVSGDGVVENVDTSGSSEMQRL